MKYKKYKKYKESKTIQDIFTNDESFNDFFRPTKTTIVAFFVFTVIFSYLYYAYGLLDTVNTFLIGDPAEYRDTYYDPEADAWGLGIGLQGGAFFFMIYFLASFVSWIFCKFTKQK